MVLRNKTYEHDANVETWQLCFVLRRSCEKNLVDWTRKVAKFRPPHRFTYLWTDSVHCDDHTLFTTVGPTQKHLPLYRLCALW